MLIKILGVAIVTVVLNIVLKQYKPEFSLLTNVCGGLLIFLMIIDSAKIVIDSMINLNEVSGLNVDIVSPVLKILGVGYITEFTANLAEDSGNKSIASKVILGGKIAICVVALPIIKSLINAIISLI